MSSFADIVSDVQSRLNLTSNESRDRIGRRVNERYRRVTSGIGLDLTRRITVSALSVVGTQVMTFLGIEKIINVVDRVQPRYRVLDEVSVEYIRSTQKTPNSQFATVYAITGYGSGSVTIEMDCIPTTPFTLFSDGLQCAPILSGVQIPAFPESFHDVLFHGALDDEDRKMEKIKLAEDEKAEFEQRFSDLRMFLAKSSYAAIVQGRTRPNFPTDQANNVGLIIS
jgi:hypothetical protein